METNLSTTIPDKLFLHIGFQGLEKEIFLARFNKNVSQKIIKRFKTLMPFTASAPAHTVSSGQNLIFAIPDVELENYISTQKKKGVESRSSAAAGSLFLRNSQLASFMYDKSEDHGVYMPCILQVEESEIKRLKITCAKFWEMQAQSNSKLVLSIDFLYSSKPDTVPFPIFSFKKTNNTTIDKSIEYITGQTSNIWVYPPIELIKFLKYGDKDMKEGTGRQVFPLHVIFNGVVMLIASFAHAAPINFILELIRNLQQSNANKKQIDCVVKFVCDYLESHLAYLRSIPTEPLISVCETYITSLKSAKNFQEIKALTDAFTLFGARIHSWVIYFFPFYVGKKLTYENLESFLPFPSGYKGNLPLQHVYNFNKDGFLLIQNPKFLGHDIVKTNNILEFIKQNKNIQNMLLPSLIGENIKSIKLELINFKKIFHWQQMINHFPESRPTEVNILVPIDHSVSIEIIMNSHMLGTCFGSAFKSTKDKNILDKTSHLLKSNIVTKFVKNTEILCINNLTLFRVLEGEGKIAVLTYKLN